MACLASLSAAAVTVEPTGSTAGKTYERRDWRVRVDGSFTNPFDPDEIAVDAMFTGPGDVKLTVPAFWMTQPDGGDGAFAVRFAPTLPGHWTLRVAANHRGDKSESNELSFDVAKGDSRGFVRTVQSNPRYFQYDSGDPYFVMGLNISWGIGKALSSFDPMFAKLSAAGGNFARVWMSDPNFMTETAAAGLGRYDQAACANYDAIFESAQAHGIACEVTFNNYRDLREHDNWGPCPWQSLPYAAVNGGPCTQPADFISLPICQKLYRQRLRYIVGRYSAFTSVAFWEFFNEQTFAEVPIPPSWTIGMATYLQSIDPYAHPVSTSFGNNPQSEVWKSDVIGLTQSHIYGGETTPDCVPAVAAAVAEYRAFNKPYLVAELGINADKPDNEYDKHGTAINLHNGVWAAMLSGAAGGSVNWWWDNYVAKQNLWDAYRGASAFSRQVDWPRRSFEPVQVPAALNVDTAQPETFSDSVLNASGGWGKAHGQTVVLAPNGQANASLPHYVYGFGHLDLQTPTKVQATIPAGGGEMVLRVSRVSDASILRVLIDGEPQADFLLSLLAPDAPKPASPASAPARRRRRDERAGLQGPLTKEFTLPVPAGQHTIEIQNLGSDWFMLDSVTLTKTKSSRYADLEILSLRDTAAGEALAWLHDPQANWRNDWDGKPARVTPPARVALPLGAGAFKALWFDTRDGKMLSEADATAKDGNVELETPPITGDIALRVIRRQ